MTVGGEEPAQRLGAWEDRGLLVTHRRGGWRGEQRDGDDGRDEQDGTKGDHAEKVEGSGPEYPNLTLEDIMP